jgi:hypothetical protein
MVKLSGFFKNISIILLVICLLTVYAFLRENLVGILFNTKGEHLFTVSRNQFFYGCLSTAVIYHTLFHLFKQGYLSVKRTPESEIKPGDYKNRFLTWWNFVGMSVNIFFICILIFTGLANNAEDIKFSSITLLPVLGVIPLILSVLACIPLYFIVKKEQERQHS